MKHPLMKLMAAGLVCLVVVTYCLTGRLDVGSTVLADMRLAVENMPLVHRTIDTHRDGTQHHTENWYYFQTRTVVSKFSQDGRCVKISALNYDTMEEYVYDPGMDVVTRSYRTNVSADSLPESPWAVVEECLRDFRQGEASLERRRGTFEANAVDIYQFAIPPNSRDERGTGEFIVQHESRLPVQYKCQFWTQEGEPAWDQLIHFDFPPSGPNDIYDLGVSRSTRVVYDPNSKVRLELKRKLTQDRQTYEREFQDAQRENGTYHLDNGQLLKFIAASQVGPRARLDWLYDTLRYLESHEGNNAPPDVIETEFTETGHYLAYVWDGRLVTNGAAIFTQGVSLSQAFERIVGLSKFEYQVPDVLRELKIEGDWIVRQGAAKTEVLNALEAIVRQQTQRPIRFEHRLVERDVIVARGRFEFQPMSDTYDDEWIHVYSDVLDPDERGGGGSGTLAEFLHMLGDIPLNQQVVDETDGTPGIRLSWGWHYSCYLRKLTDEKDRQKKLTMLLDHLSQQTGLRFTQERCPVSVWTVTERPD